MKLLALCLGCSWALVAFDKGRVEEAPLFPKARMAVVSTRAIERLETREERLLRLAHEYAVPERIFRGVYKIESSSGRNVKPKFEKHVVKWLLSDERPADFKKKLRAFGTTKDKLKLLATSHGALQVMGYHALDYGVDPLELAANPVLQDTLGMVRLSHAWLSSRKEETHELKRVALTGKNYNGSWQYAAKLVKEVRG